MAAAKERVFTSTHGVKFEDTGPKGEYQPWAHFKPAPQLREPNGPEVFRFVTSDPKVAARLLGIDGYDIEEIEEVTEDVAD